MEEVEAQRRLSKLGSKHRKIVANRSRDNDSTRGSMSVIANVTCAGNVSIHITQTLLQCINSWPPQQQQHIRQQLTSIVQQMRDVVKQQLSLLSSQQPEAGAPQPSTDVEQLSGQLVQFPLHGNISSSAEAAASGQGNVDTAAAPASHDSKTRPRSNVQRPAPTVADSARSLNGAPGAVDVASYTCPHVCTAVAVSSQHRLSQHCASWDPKTCSCAACHQSYIYRTPAR